MGKDDGLRYGEGLIVERPQAHGATKYQAQWRDGDRRRAKTFPSRDAAEDHLRQVARDKRDGRYAAPLDLTVSALIAEHLERARRRLTARTILTYQQRTERMIAPYLGTKQIAALTTLDVQRWVDRLDRAGYKPATIQPAVAVLSGALREAVTLGLLPRNVAVGIRRPAIEKPRTTVWSEADAQTALAATADDPIYGVVYALALGTGMRPGEVRALAWRDVDLDAGTLTVRRTISRGADGGEIITERTKSGRVRVVGLLPVVVERLTTHRTSQRLRRLAAETWHDLDLVCDRGDGHWLYQSGWQRYHRDLCKTHKLPTIRCHDLRHSFATIMLGRGIHPKIVSEMLGHASVEMTLDRYSHVSLDLQRVALDALNQALSPPSNTTTSHYDTAQNK